MRGNISHRIHVWYSWENKYCLCLYFRLVLVLVFQMCRFSTVVLPVEANCAKELGAYDGRREWISHEISWQCWEVHFGKLAWNLKITLLKRNLIFQTSIFAFQVNFPGCCEWLKSVPFQRNRWCDPPGDRFSSEVDIAWPKIPNTMDGEFPKKRYWELVCGTFDDSWWLSLQNK